MACTVILELNVKSDSADDVAESFKSTFPDTRSYDGCIDVYATRNQDNPDNFLLVETWESREKYEKYLSWRTERGDMDNLAAVLEGEPSIRFLNRIGA